MIVLAIETSCDETAIAVVKKEGANFTVLADAMVSQIKIHEEWGGVVPNLAKREHAKNLLPILKKVILDSSLLKHHTNQLEYVGVPESRVEKMLEREGDLAKELLEFVKTVEIPEINAIAVTHGPGLEPALWVGLNFAKALSILWGKPLIPINHMEGHIMSVLLEKDSNDYKTRKIEYPSVSLLISGGHTELVLAEKPLSYKIIGQTRDDAVGESFDKVARILGLPYPGGPEISRLAKEASGENDFKLPSPMINSDDFDFSFSGLKTSVLYKVKKIDNLTNSMRADMAQQFENAASKVLIKKTLAAVEKFGAKTLIIGGGVSANETIRTSFENKIKNRYSDTTLLLPDKKLSTDNAIMIGITALLRAENNQLPEAPLDISASGNLALN